MNDDITGEVGWIDRGGQRQNSRSRVIQYLLLYVIIVFGVAGGILLANWITGRDAQAPDGIVAAQGERVAEADGSLADKAGHVASKVGSGLNTVFKQVTTKLKVGRSSSETGPDLKQQCEDWTRAYEKGHTETALAEMDKYCGRYKGYLAAGGPLPE